MTCFDPDAPDAVAASGTGSLVDIPADVTSLAAGAGAERRDAARRRVPRAATTAAAAFMGAAPPEGDQVAPLLLRRARRRRGHLGVDADASPAVVSFNLAFKTLGRAIVTAPTSTERLTPVRSAADAA